ncbi:MAG: hypothetical protein O7B30_01265 [Thaumarchaeota archaeon]|nr:hypothetical protein [Nitrososphaerota archaeon]
MISAMNSFRTKISGYPNKEPPVDGFVVTGKHDHHILRVIDSFGGAY